jgi:hypothetical protein
LLGLVEDLTQEYFAAIDTGHCYPDQFWPRLGKPRAPIVDDYLEVIRCIRMETALQAWVRSPDWFHAFFAT